MLAIAVSDEDQLFIISRDVSDIVEAYPDATDYISHISAFMAQEGQCEFDRILLVENDEVVDDFEA